MEEGGGVAAPLFQRRAERAIADSVLFKPICPTPPPKGSRGSELGEKACKSF